MPSRKKHKTTHEDLSHEEIWDDSALLRSWNDALEEYKFYHSIHARGEDVDEILKREEAGSSVLDDAEDVAGRAEDETVQQAEVDIDDLMANVEVEAEGSQDRLGNGETDGVQAGEKDLDDSGIGKADQTLENIKMAYYWAGYYSGLYEGQRRAGK